MSKETTYPSQINTKTISCRISSLDYVSFLQDALSKGITLNDWLLVKIYGQNDSKSQINDSKIQINGIDSGNEVTFPFTIEMAHNDYTFYDLNDIEDFINDTLGKEQELLLIIANLKKENKLLYEYRKTNINLDNEDDRGLVKLKLYEKIDQTKWESKKDKIEMMTTLKELFDDLFE